MNLNIFIKLFDNRHLGLNHPRNLQLAQQVVKEMEITKNIPRKQRIHISDISETFSTWFGFSKKTEIVGCKYVNVTLDKGNFLEIEAGSYDFYDDSDDFDILLVQINLDTLRKLSGRNVEGWPT